MWMSIVKPEAEAARRQLERLLENKLFARSEQLSRLLRFLVERHLEGRDQEIKESVIGVEVFGRDPDYNPKFDPIVRTEARRLRARLNEYYESEGKHDVVRIDLPKGGYVPVVQGAAGQQATSTGEARAPRFSKWPLIALAATVFTVILVVLGLTQSNLRGLPLLKTRSAAHDLYIRARGFEALPNVTGIESSISLFQRAVEKDPSYAPAYAGIAAGYAAKSGFDGFDTAERTEMLARGWAAAEKAFRLDPRSADAHEGLAMMQARQAQWELAERSFRRAIELAPRDVLWREHFVMFLLLPLGRVEQALRELRVTEELDPLSPQTHTLLGVALSSAGRFDEALSHCQKGAANDQMRARCWADNLLRQGRNDEAVRILEEVWKGHLMEPGAQALGIAYARAGRPKDAERIAVMLPRFASRTHVFAALEDKDRTFKMLDQIAPMGPARVGRDFLISPNFAFLRGDPRLTALRKKVGLPE
jgi:tetratricopeptide (TPR) repeat protein